MQQELLTPGFVIAGKYVVERTLGRGGMGAVYVVSHANTGKRLALKVLLPEFVHNADIVGRFLREAQVMGRLQHRHVVDVFDVGRDGDVLFIVMELLEGKPLSDLLHDESLTLEEALVILLRAMEGIAAAHDVGVVHRDIKPDNIFVCIGASGRLDDPRVLDFGISKLDDGMAEQLTRSGVAMGTPYYMSIEQLNGQRDLDARVDVYAMGVILYEAISGTPPYTADSISALAIRVLTTTPVHLRELRPDLPPGLADVVMRAMAKQRDERYRSMRQLIEALRPFVPRSAGLLVPEGQGLLLRTPGVPKTPLRQHSAVQVRAPEEGGDDEQPLRRGITARGAAVVIALLLVAGIAALFAQERAQDASAAPAPTAAPAATAAEAPQRAKIEAAEEPIVLDVQGGSRAEAPVPPVPPEPREVAPPAQPEATRANAASGRSSVEVAEPKTAEPKRAEPKAAEPTAAESKTAEPKAAPARTRSRRSRAEASASAAEPETEIAPTAPIAPAAPAPPPAPPARKSAEGRAGKLGSDEF